jgi:peptidyl-prolyl cis-trans isomerase A (cyclophilin A)/peptidyl-prolyl cis-trans isomerase B (cyclophilin B)
MRSLISFMPISILIMTLLGLSTFAFAQDAAAKPVDSKAAKDPSDSSSAWDYVLMTTNKGDILLRLNKTLAPVSTANFLKYAKAGEYNGTIFHRVISDFMIQGGGFNTDYEKRTSGTGIKNEWTNGLKNQNYTIAMARVGGNPDSATNQFFINVKDNGFLDRPQGDGAAYAVFGHVIAGKKAVDAIRDAPTQDRGGPLVTSPVDQIVIENVKQVDFKEAEKIAAANGEAASVCSDLTPNEKQANEVAAKIKTAMEKQKKMTSTDIKPDALPGMPVDRAADGSNEAGLKWWTIKAGDGVTPVSTSDTVKVHYTGYLLDGTKFDSSVDRNEPIEFALDRVIPGWTVGVGSMKVGETRKLQIPATLGYGARGAGGGLIPANATLVFDVQLLNVTPAKGHFHDDGSYHEGDH